MIEPSQTPLHNGNNGNGALSAQGSSREEFIAQVQSLRDDLQQHPNAWPNDDLPSFLEALQAWVEDMDGYFANQGQPIPEQPSWQLLANILRAATIYE